MGHSCCCKSPRRPGPTTAGLPPQSLFHPLRSTCSWLPSSDCSCLVLERVDDFNWLALRDRLQVQLQHERHAFVSSPNGDDRSGIAINAVAHGSELQSEHTLVCEKPAEAELEPGPHLLAVVFAAKNLLEDGSDLDLPDSIVPLEDGPVQMRTRRLMPPVVSNNLPKPVDVEGRHCSLRRISKTSSMSNRTSQGASTSAIVSKSKWS